MGEEIKFYPAPAEHINLQEVLLGIQHLLAQFNWQNGRRVLPTTRGLRIPMRLVGVWCQPANSLGIREHLLQRKWKDALLGAGIDPNRIEILDQVKLRTAIDRIEDRRAQQKRERARRREGEKDCGLHMTEDQFSQLTRQKINRGWASLPAAKPSALKPASKEKRVTIPGDKSDVEFPPSGVRQSGTSNDWPYPW
jgi:hypothetical protein